MHYYILLLQTPTGALRVVARLAYNQSHKMLKLIFKITPFSHIM
jgi:hypothetical protein